MKWKNKGHEYDDLFQVINSKKQFYLFGMGDYGIQFFNIFENEIQIKGFIDNNPSKKGTLFNQKYCYSIEDIDLKEDEGIIVTMSQITRISAREQLKALNYVEHKDFVVIEEFLSVYYVYNYDKVYFSSISFLPSTVCNLKCRYCLNFNPFTNKFYVRDWNSLVRDVDLFFSCVDYIMLFHVSGGEPLMYRHTADLIQYIDKKYGDRINTLRFVTNGTIIPDDDVMKKISQCKGNVEVTVDDYRDAVPEYKDTFDKLINKLEKYNVNYYINKVDSWIDLAPEKTDYTYMTDRELQKHRDDCNQSWQELRDGKIYNCNYAAYATVAGVAGEQDLEEVYDLTAFTPEKKKELIEFRLGYTTKGYTNFCKKCRGFTPENTEEVQPAEQMREHSLE